LKVDFKRSFLRDLKYIDEKALKNRVKETIQSIEQAQGPKDISNLKKLKYGDRYYRIRLGDYRIGLILEGNTLTFVRFLHRKDLYKYFP
jgi:mRNA interferase RelE/StbE